MTRAMHVWVIGFLLLSAAGCVSQARYDRVVEQLNAIRNELNVAKAEELALTREAEALKSLHQRAKRDVLTASDDLQRASEEAEAERHRADGQFVTLQRALGQLNVQLITLSDKLAEAKSDTTALKELVAVYQRKVRAEFEADEPTPASPEVTGPEAAGVSLMAPALVEIPVETTRAEPPQPAPAAASEDEGLFAPLLDWLASLWYSIMAFLRGLFP